MAYAFNGTSQYMNIGTTPVNAAPMTMAVRFNPNNVTANMVGFQISNGTANERFGVFFLGAVAGDPARASSIANGVASDADATAAFQQSVWQQVTSVFASSSSRNIYLDGGNSSSNTTSSTPTGVDRIDIGARINSGVWGLYMDGSLSDIAIWSATLTAAEISSLAKGFKPTRIRPQSLVFYAPLIRNLQDVRGGLALTNNNSATVADHPRVY